MVDAGLLEKREYQEAGERTRFSYHLTPAGVDLKLVLAALQQWGDVHVTACGRTDSGPARHPSKALVDVGFVGKDGHAVPDEDVVVRTRRRWTGRPQYLALTRRNGRTHRGSGVCLLHAS
jgi:hypothetical protein